MSKFGTYVYFKEKSSLHFVDAIVGHDPTTQKNSLEK